MRLFEEASGSTDAFQNHYFDFLFSTTQSNVIGPKLCEMYSRDEVKSWIRDLYKLNLIWWFDFKHKPIFATSLFAAKVVKKDLKLIILLLFQKLSLSPYVRWI